MCVGVSCGVQVLGPRQQLAPNTDSLVRTYGGEAGTEGRVALEGLAWGGEV